MNSDQPKVSIIMPAKNAGKYIAECLSSIQRQTFSFWELIIVNDHSTDNTVSIIENACSSDSRIKLYHNKGNGIIPALQLALSFARGIYITRMDADDIMPDNKLQLMVEAISTAPEKTIVTGLVKYISEFQVSEGYKKYEQWLNERVQHNDHWKWVYRECVIASPNWLIRKEELLEGNGFDNLTYPEDYDHVLKWYDQGFQIKPINKVTLLWREHPERTSRNSDHYNQESFFQLKLKHFIKHQLENSKLVLWGETVKGKLTAQILETENVAFTWMGLNQKGPGRGLQSYRTIEKMTAYKLLISVYPEGQQMKALLSYLDGLGLKMAEDFWFL